MAKEEKAKRVKKTYAQKLQETIAKALEGHNKKQLKLNEGAAEIERLKKCLAVLTAK
jgi:hypothetical protein